MTRKERLNQIIEIFAQTEEKPATELEYIDPYQLAVAVVLSAQCTDKRVNIITPALFDKFPTSKHMAHATQEEIFELIKSCSYPNNKAKNLLGMAQKLEQDFGGKVPDNIDDLQKLPGVGRKTANVVAAVAFGKSTMPVDTHVFRVAQRMGIVKASKNTPASRRPIGCYLSYR